MKKWSIPNLGPIVQVAYAVDNLEDATTSWSELFGIEPFFIKEHIPLNNVRINGVNSTFDHSSAYAQWGSLMVELICEHTQKLVHRSNQKEETIPSVHHYAVFVNNFEKASRRLKNMGFEEILYAETSSGLPFAMHDTRKIFGHFVEIYEPNEELTNFYRMVEESSRNGNEK
jgi:hypothetical protein